MCSYVTVPADISGSAKGPDGWFSVTSASVYFDHPFHAPFEHSLNIDFVDTARGPGARVAVELSADSARELIRCIESALEAAGSAAFLTDGPVPFAAGVHLPWSKVSPAVHEWATQFGGDPTEVTDVSGGFSPGATARLRFPDHPDVFIKAVGAGLNADSPGFHRREGVIAGSLPASALWPQLLGVFDDEDWVALAFAAIDGHLPHHPWRDQELEAVLVSLKLMHEELTPNPSPQVESAVARRRDVFYGWQRLSERSVPSDTLDPWVREHLPRIVQLESRWPEACEGTTLLHGDLRSDNMLLTAHGATFVDWPHAMVGHAALDLVCWAPSVALEGGPLPENLLARHQPSRDVDPAAVLAMVAAVSGFFIDASLLPPPPGLPTLRRFQAAQGRVAVEWLQRCTGW